MVGGIYVWIARITCFHSSGLIVLKQKQKDYLHKAPLLPCVVKRVMGSRRRNMRCQQIRGRMLSGPEGIWLILYQVHAASEPEQLQLGHQLGQVRHNGNQHRTGPSTDPISGCSVDLAFEQLHRRGHRRCQRRRPVSAAKQQVPNSHNRNLQSLQLYIRLLPGNQLHFKLSSALVQMIDQLGLTGQWPKVLVIDPHSKSLKPLAPILHLLEFGDQVAHYLHAGCVTRLAPKH
jgi:hypothetical protein